MRTPEALARDRAVLLVIDIQERLTAAMPPAVAEQTVRNAAILVEAAARLGVPIVWSEQYPKGLGKTVAAIDTALGAASAAGARVHRVEKLEFSLAPHLGAPGRSPGRPVIGTDAPASPSLGAPDLGLPESPQWILAGMETHVCVYQTARDLLGVGGSVHVVADAVCSRTKANWRIGVERLRAEAAAVTSTESVVFELLGRAGTDEFKALSKLIK
jgi:nicotinamidase-related amidase